jgi:hypothetical protein
MEVPAVEKAVTKHWAAWAGKLGHKLQGAKIEEGAGTALIQYIRRLMVDRHLNKPTPTGWMDDEWAQVQKAPPIIVLPYNVTGQGKKIERAMRIVPFCNAKSVRLVDSPLSQVWLENLLGFPLAGHDDAVDASVAGIEPFAGVREGIPAITQELLDACCDN